jgi:threonine/homoserine/homoserine lactone efflux protein
MMGISVAGLGALLHAFPTVFGVLRLAGAAYLAYLGVKCWRTPVTDQDAGWIAPTAPAAQSATLYRQGFLVAASNPKAILFAAAFFPQFIDQNSAQLPQFAILLATFSVIEIAWYMVYALSGNHLSGYLRRTPVMKAFNRITGGIFVGFAALMAFAHE